MSPENAECLKAASIDCCALANNHILDWGRAGLLDTLSTLEHLHIKTAGAGRDLNEASAPAMLEVGGQCRLLVFSLASPTSGVPRNWVATAESPGVNFLRDLSENSLVGICEQIARARRPGDIVVVSIHWGPNWGYEISDDQVRFARALIDRADVTVVHGHSSHHAKAIEVYRNRLILYGCGDFLNDYEGISGYEEFRDDLALMYFVDIDRRSRELVALDIVPLQIRRFRLVRVSSQDVVWLQRTLDRECEKYATHVALAPEGRLAVSWSGVKSQ
jgi:poly-gamma-glutamate synthesis protein (capsule biosynthesis protein)